MKYSTQLLMGIAAPLAAAHTTFTTLYINDVSQGDGTCVRMNPNPSTSSNPLENLASDDMACNVGGSKAVAYTCPAAAGAKLTFEWREWADYSQPGSIDISHKGPCALYAKQVGDMATSTAAGPGWVKIWEEGYDDATGKWCTEKLIDAGGLMSVQIPPGLPSGNFLFRPELLALHEAQVNDPQFYTGCAQVQVQGGASGTFNPPAEYSVSIPGYVKAGDPSVSFNIYTPKFPYPMPGPSVYEVPASSGSLSTQSAAQIAGALTVPSNCLIKEGNWCGVEVADYSTEDGCWAASDACYKQAQTCYDDAGPPGSNNCKVWEAKCKGIQDACSAGNFNGPPNKGVQLKSVEGRGNVGIPAAGNLGGSTDVAVPSSPTSTYAAAPSPSASSASSASSAGAAASSSATSVSSGAGSYPTTTASSPSPTSTAGGSTSGGDDGETSPSDGGDDSGDDEGDGSDGDDGDSPSTTLKPSSSASTTASASNPTTSSPSTSGGAGNGSKPGKGKGCKGKHNQRRHVGGGSLRK